MHEAELDLVVEEAHARGRTTSRVGGRHAALRLGEDHVEGLRVRIHAGLDHVLTVVRALTQELLVTGDGRQKLDIGLLQRRSAQAGQGLNRIGFEERARRLEDAGNGR